MNKEPMFRFQDSDCYPYSRLEIKLVAIYQ